MLRVRYILLVGVAYDLLLVVEEGQFILQLLLQGDHSDAQFGYGFFLRKSCRLELLVVCAEGGSFILQHL